MVKPRRALAAAALVLLGPVSGCNTSAKAPEPSHALPPMEGTAQPNGPLPHAEHPLAMQGDPIAAEHAGVDPHAGSEPHAQMPQGEPMTPGDIAFDKQTVIAGTFNLVAKTKDKVKAGDTMFVVVRGAGEHDAPGPVLAVRRLEAGAFPMPFQIDSRDAMVAGTTMKAPVTLTVRVDKDGDAMSKNPGDVVGTAVIKALPQPKLSVVLDTVL